MRSHPILMVEDDEDDRLLILEAFASIGRSDRFCFFNCGCDLMKYLDSLPASEHPLLVVLDYNMPVLNGGATLRLIRRHPVHSQVPVVVFSTEFSREVRSELAALDVLSCIRKGNDFQKLVEQVRFFNELIADDVDTLLGNY